MHNNCSMFFTSTQALSMNSLRTQTLSMSILHTKHKHVTLISHRRLPRSSARIALCRASSALSRRSFLLGAGLAFGERCGLSEREADGPRERCGRGHHGALRQFTPTLSPLARIVSHTVPIIFHHPCVHYHVSSTAMCPLPCVIHVSTSRCHLHF